MAGLVHIETYSGAAGDCALCNKIGRAEGVAVETGAGRACRVRVHEAWAVGSQHGFEIGVVAVVRQRRRGRRRRRRRRGRRRGRRWRGGGHGRRRGRWRWWAGWRQVRRHCVLNLPDRLELAAIVTLVADAAPANRTRVDDAALITPWRWRRCRFGWRRRSLHGLVIFFVSPNLRQKIVRRPLQGRVYPKCFGGGAEVRKTAEACRLWYQKGSERHDPGGRLSGAHLWTAAAALSTSGQAHTATLGC